MSAETQDSAPPIVTSFLVRAGSAAPSDSLEVERNAQVTLTWQVDGADSVVLTDPAQLQDREISVASGHEANVTPGDAVQTYSLVAVQGQTRSAPATVMVSTHEADEVVSSHASVAHGPAPRVYTPHGVPDAPAVWPGVAAQLASSRIVNFDGNPNPSLPRWMNGEADIDNSVAIASFTQQLQDGYGLREFWMVVVPGTSEVAAPSGGESHHTMYVPRGGDDPNVDVISPEFRARLDHAYQMLQRDAVRFIFISGGAVDLLHPEYVEAKRGRTYLIGKYANGDINSPLWNQIIVDPWAVHSEMNLRNGAATSALLGLDRCLVLTTYKTMSPADQGYMFEHMHNYPMGFAHGSTIDGFCDAGLGYRLGDMKKLPAGPDHLFDTRGAHDSTSTAVFLLYGFDAGALVGDDHWTVGGQELASGRLHGITPLTDAQYQQLNPGM